MAASVGITTVAGYLKDRYGEISRILSSFAELQKRIKLTQRERIGANYQFPVITKRSHGTTWAGSTAGTVYTLNSPISFETAEASLTGTEFTLQEDVAYGALSRARSQGEEAFGDLMDEVVVGLLDSAQYYLELTMLYGGDGIGTIGVVAGSSGTRTWTQSSAAALADWSPGIWSNLENAEIDVYATDLSTKRNSNAVITVTSVDTGAATPVISVSGNETDLTACVAGDRIVPRGAVGNWFTGLKGIANNTGTLFGISASTNNVWKANKFSVGAQQTLSVVHRMITKAVSRGMKGNATVCTNVYSWSDINNELSALKRFADDTKSEMAIGTNSIKLYSVSGGTLELLPHPLLVRGDSFAFVDKDIKRVGSSDATLRLPHLEQQEEAFFQELESKTGIRLRCWWDQALIHTKPARLVYASGIVPVTGV